MTRHTFSGVAGMSNSLTPEASMMALITAGGAPNARGTASFGTLLA
jgi:hypothetical protein